MIGAGELVTSIIVVAVGAVLDYAVVASPDQTNTASTSTKWA